MNKLKVIPTTPIKQNKEIDTLSADAGWFPTFNMQNSYLSKGDISMENVGFAIDLQDGINEEALRKATFDLEKKFDTCRLHFKKGQQGWMQKIAPLGKQCSLLTFIDNTEIEAQSFEALWRLNCAQITESFDVELPQLVKIIVFRTPDELPDRLAVMFNHLVTDGYSLGGMLGFLYNNYHAYLEKRPIRDTLATHSIKSYYELIGQYLNESQLRDKVDYWLNKELWSQPKQSLYSTPPPIPYNKNKRSSHYEMQHFHKKKITLDKTHATQLTQTLMSNYKLDLDNGIILIVMYSLAQQLGAGFFPAWVTDSARHSDSNDEFLSQGCGLIATNTILGFKIDPKITLQTWLISDGEQLIKARQNTAYFSAIYHNNLTTEQITKNELAYIRDIQHPEILFNFVRAGFTTQQVNKLIPLEGTESQYGREYYGIQVLSELYLNELIITIRYNNLLCDENMINQLLLSIENSLSSITS